MNKKKMELKRKIEKKRNYSEKMKQYLARRKRNAMSHGWKVTKKSLK